jgi:hypothetical protein
LLQNQAAFLAQQIEGDRRFARIEADLEQIKTFLLRHEEILAGSTETIAALTKAIRQKIGFKPSK